MTKEKINLIITMYKDIIPSESTSLLCQKLESAPEQSYETLLSLPMKNPTTILLFSIFLGGLGVDRFILGDVGLGICKLLFGWVTFGIWPLIDIFCSYNRAKKLNLESILCNI